MPREQVLGDVTGDHRLIGLKQAQISVAHLRRHLEPNMQELTKARVICGVGGVMAQR